MKLIEIIIEPIEDEWLGNTLMQHIDDETVSLDKVFKEFNK